MYACNKPGSAANVRWEFDKPTITVGFPCTSAGKESAWNAGDPGLIPGSGRSADEGIGYQLQYSCASIVAQLVKNPPAMRGTRFDTWVGKIPWRKERLRTPGFWPEEFCRLYSPWDCKEWDTTKQLSLSHWICRLLWVVQSFSWYQFIQSKNMDCLSICLCSLLFLSSLSYSFLSTEFLSS